MKLKVPDMTCGHCVQTVEKAVKSVDPAAQVEVDLAQKIATIETTAPEQSIADVVRSAGYENEIRR
jgi:copper chaperone CopZ